MQNILKKDVFSFQIMLRTIIVVFIFSSQWVSAQQWTQIEDFPGNARDDGASFVIGNIAYCGTGMDFGFLTTSDFYAFDMGTELWSSINGLPAGNNRQYATTSSIGNKGYLFGGINGSGNYLNDLWEYNPSSDVWNLRAPLPSFGRSGSMSAVVNNKLYVFGGKDSSGTCLAELWCYDPSIDSWTQKSSNFLTQGVWRGLMISSNGQLITMYGLDSSGNIVQGVQVYNALSDSWTSWLSTPPTPRKYPAYSVIGNKLFVYGGDIDSTDFLNCFESLNLTNGQWSSLNWPSFNARRGGMAFTSTTDFYLTTGVSATERLNETWVSRHVINAGEIEFDNIDIVYNNVNKTLVINGGDEISNYVIMGSDGREVLFSDNSSSEIELSGLQTGVYFYLISSGSYSRKGKIVLID